MWLRAAECFCLVYIYVFMHADMEKDEGGTHFSKWKFHFLCLSSLSQQLGSVRVRWVFSELCPDP